MNHTCCIAGVDWGGKGEGGPGVVNGIMTGAAGMLPVAADEEEREAVPQPECAGH